MHRVRAVLSSLLLVLAVAGCRPAPSFESVAPALDAFEPFELQLRMNEQGVLIVDVESSEGPLELILDTGADQAMLLFEGSLSDPPRFERVGSQGKWNASGRFVRAPVLLVPELQIGPLRYAGARAPIEDMRLPPFMSGADGVLGRACFDGLTLDIDGPGRRLGVLPAGARPADFDERSWHEVELLDMRNGPVVPLRLDESTHELRVVLDTGAIARGSGGSYGVVELPPDLEPRPDLEHGLPVYHAKSVLLGDAQLGPMRFYVKHHPQPPRTQGFLGNALYMHRRVIIEPAAQRVWIESP